VAVSLESRSTQLLTVSDMLNLVKLLPQGNTKGNTQVQCLRNRGFISPLKLRFIFLILTEQRSNTKVTALLTRRTNRSSCLTVLLHVY